MTFLPAEPLSSEGQLFLQAGDGSFKIGLPGNLAARVRAAGAKKVDIGIRPVHMELLHSAPRNEQVVLEGSIITYEDLGEEGQLAVRVGGSQVLAVTQPALQLRRGETVTLAMRPDRVQLFDGATQKAI